MTLIEIISSALEQLGRTSDAQTLAIYKRKFTALANEGMFDLGDAIKMRRTDPLIAAGGELDLSLLPYQLIKVRSLKQGEDALDVEYGSSTGKLAVSVTGAVNVEYYYYPKQLSSDTDVPGIPEPLHHLLPLYICAREHSEANVDTQSRYNTPYMLYKQGKNQARKSYGERENYKIIHRGSW